MKLIIFPVLLSLFFSFGSAFGQRQERYESEDKQEQQEYDQEFIYGVNWNTFGGLIGGFNFKYAWQHKNDQNRFHMLGLEFVHVKHPKEISVPSSSGLDYIYGKSGNFFVIRPHYGQEMILFNKAEEEGVQISVIAAGGPSLGYLKPYYVYFGDSLEVAYPTQFQPYMNTDKVYGNAGFFKGFDEMVAYAGVHGKLSLNFEYGQFKSSVAGIEAGVMAEAFTNKIVIIPQAANRSFFLSLFINVYFGIR